MLSFLQNPWVVGIGGGIISGIIVFFITNWIYKRKDASKYLEQISRANTDIIQTLKPYVAEQGLPEKEIVDAIIVSTARKYNVKSDELYSIRIICEELIREIVENVYVASDKKREYSLQLKEYLQAPSSEQHKQLLISDIKKEIDNADTIMETNYRRKTATMISMLLSLFAGCLTVILSVFSTTFFDTPFPFWNTDELELILLIFLAFSVLMVAYTLVFVTTKRKSRDNITHSKKADADNEKQ
ncbi:hypothetical protein [uncultured Dysosmobacter sp.]|uniref:hypothetical protein n=1 Tax=uncultured Dysosmobacter sp. TaxID=2591384 RepID=UPI0026099C15|nr:hypothetical protein [uncultured Dysosmobacter sp.]